MAVLHGVRETSLHELGTEMLTRIMVQGFSVFRVPTHLLFRPSIDADYSALFTSAVHVTPLW